MPPRAGDRRPPPRSPPPSFPCTARCGAPGAAARAARRALRARPRRCSTTTTAIPELGPARLAEWARLDTHDALTDRYKHLRDAGQIRAALEAAGLSAVEVAEAGNGIEARATRNP